MARRTPPSRVQDVARAACRLFIEKGYRRTLMTDVGARLNLSHALLYRVVESKEALFELAVIYAIDKEAVSGLSIPLPTPPIGHTLGLVEQWAEENADFPVLAAFMAETETADIAHELANVIDERYQYLERNRRLLGLIERSALDLPELYSLYFTKVRRSHYDQLSTYLKSRIRTGKITPVQDVDVAVRFITESASWFAWHRRNDPDAAMIEDGVAQQTVRELLVRAFVANGSPPDEA
jgi:AcrR family transcriptional regulator